MNARADIAFLVGSDSRVRLLRALSASPRRPTELAAECGCARETAQRTLAGFVERNWVAKDESTYRLTSAGEMVLADYERLATTTECADRLRVFLSHIGSVVDDLQPSTLDGLTAARATAENPHAPINRYLTVVGDSPVDSLRGIAPIVSRVFNESGEAIMGPTTTMELVIDESVLATSESAYPEALRRARELDRFSIFVHPADIDFGMALVDGHALLAAYDAGGNMVASVDGPDDEFTAWANERYADYRDQSRRLDLLESPGSPSAGWRQ